jgi:uncharacterized membrane protein YcaP (DUF421 family)
MPDFPVHHFYMFLRTLFMYLMVLVVLRIMGKREVGELSPFDLVVAIMIAELAAIPMENIKIPLTHGIIPIVTLMVAEVGLAYLCLKSERARNWINGKPNVLIANGKIVELEMRKCRYNISDLMAQLREKGIVNIADVEFAILETSGELSVIPKSQKRPLCPEDLNVKTEYEGLPIILIDDGRILHKHLKDNNLSLEWLECQINLKGAKSIKDVLFASLDSQGNLFVNPRIAKLDDKLIDIE